MFHNGSTYDYHFIFKKLVKEFEGQFECLGENTEKYITFSVPIKKELDNGKTITYKLKFIDSFRFMSSSLSSLVDNLSHGLHCDKYIDWKSYLAYMITKDDQLIFRCFECKKNYQKDYNKDLINRSASKYEFCNKHINTFILLLRKGIYPYEYINSWERFDETLLSDKETFYSSVNMEGITSVDYRHAKRVYKEFKINNLVIIMIHMFKVIYYCLQRYLKILEINVLKNINLNLLIFYQQLD